MTDDARSSVSQRAWAGPGSTVLQAGGDIIHVQLSERHGPGLVSVTPPWGQLPVHLHGRDAVSTDLLGLLDKPPGRVVVLHGAGGYGKSALALWLARQAADRQLPVWWVSARDAQVLAEGLREVALQSHADPRSVEQAWLSPGSATDLLWRTLNARHGRWVLVVDNADDVDVLAGGGRVADGTGWLRHPDPEHGLVIVTTRQGSPSFWPGSDLRQLTGLGTTAAGRMLIDLAGKDAGSPQNAERLGERLGGLPLALRLAGRYLAASGDAFPVPGAIVPRTFADYVAAVGDRLDLLDAPPGDHDEEREERELITRTWELSLDLLARRGHDLARPLLRLLSCFGPAPIPMDMLDAKLLSTVPAWATITSETLARLLGALRDLGLVDRTDQALMSHRLIRETNRQHAETDVEQHAAALAVLVDAATDGFSINSENWSRWHALALHAEAALDLCRAYLDRVPRDAAWSAVDAAERAVVFRRAVQDFDQAAADYRTIVDIFRETRGEHHVETLAARTVLADLRREQGLWDKAVDELQNVLDVLRRTRDGRDPTLHAQMTQMTLHIQNALAGAIGQRGDWATAERMRRETLMIALEVLGPHHEDTARFRNGVATALFCQGELAEAEVEYRKALEVCRQRLSAEHRDTVATWQGFANALAGRGNAAAALREFRAIRRICERKWGEKSKIALSARLSLANALHQLEKYTEAGEHYREIIDLGLPVFGESHPGILDSRYHLAKVLMAQGHLDSARTEFTEVLAMQRQVRSAAHPDTLDTRFQLASLSLLAGDTAAGRAEMRDFLTTARPALGGMNPLVREAEEVLRQPVLPSTPRPPQPLSRRERRQRHRARRKGGG